VFPLIYRSCGSVLGREANMKTGLRRLWWIGGAICSLPFLYVLIYVILSLFGRYGPMLEGSTTHMFVYPYWMPYGTIDSPMTCVGNSDKWKMRLLLFYFPLWEFDNRHIHKQHDIYIAGYPGADGRWNFTTNTASILASQK
jgi:hypothetical protein